MVRRGIFDGRYAKKLIRFNFDKELWKLISPFSKPVVFSEVEMMKNVKIRVEPAKEPGNARPYGDPNSFWIGWWSVEYALGNSKGEVAIDATPLKRLKKNIELYYNSIERIVRERTEKYRVESISPIPLKLYLNDSATLEAGFSVPLDEELRLVVFPVKLSLKKVSSERRTTHYGTLLLALSMKGDKPRKIVSAEYLPGHLPAFSLALLRNGNNIFTGIIRAYNRFGLEGGLRLLYANTPETHLFLLGKAPINQIALNFPIPTDKGISMTGVHLTYNPEKGEYTGDVKVVNYYIYSFVKNAKSGESMEFDVISPFKGDNIIEGVATLKRGKEDYYITVIAVEHKDTTLLPFASIRLTDSSLRAMIKLFAHALYDKKIKCFSTTEELKNSRRVAVGCVGEKKNIDKALGVGECFGKVDNNYGVLIVHLCGLNAVPGEVVVCRTHPGLSIGMHNFIEYYGLLKIYKKDADGYYDFINPPSRFH